MKTLKKKFSIYQSSQKVRKLWCDYSDARGAANSSGETDSGAVTAVASVAAGQGPGRALRAFVDAVDLADAKQAAMLQNLDEGGQGELVATLMGLAEALVGAEARSGALSPAMADIVLAEKALAVVQTCLTGTTPPRRPKDWKEHLRQLVSILAGEEGAPDGQVPVLLDTDMSRRMIEAKAAALRVLRFITVDHERVAELGRCRGFQTIARLSLPEGSLLRPQATEILGYFLATSSSDTDSNPSPTRPEARGRPGRWGRVGRFGNSGVPVAASRSRPGSECSGRGLAGEEDGLEASMGSSSSSSSLADAANFVYSSLQALVSSGRDAGGFSPPPTLGVAAGGGRGFPSGHLPMAALPDSLKGEAARLAVAEEGRPASEDTGSGATASSGVDAGTGLAGALSGMSRQELADPVTEDVADTMVAEGVLSILVDVIAPHPVSVGVEAGGGTLATEAVAPPLIRGQDLCEAEKSRLEAFEAAVLMLEKRPQAQAEFVNLGGYARISRLIHDLATSQRRVLDPSAPSDNSAERSRSQTRSRGDSLPRAERMSTSADIRVHALDAAFDGIFRLALDGHAVCPGARADGLDAIKLLLSLIARSGSQPVALRAARSLQALLRVRPMNAVALERHGTLRIVADTLAYLAFPRSPESCAGATQGGREDAGGSGKEETNAARLEWSLNGKREVMSSLNDVVRVMAAVYSRQDARAVETYADVMLSASMARFGLDSCGGPGALCSCCGATPTDAVSSRMKRCLVEGCSGAAGLCRACDRTLHQHCKEDSHVRVPVLARVCGEREFCRSITANSDNPEWAVEAGKALMKAMAVMLDDRESFGLSPTPGTVTGSVRDTVDGETLPSARSVLGVMLHVAQDELLGPLNTRRDAGADSDGPTFPEKSPVARSLIEDNNASKYGAGLRAKAACEAGWTGGWLLGALEIVARVVVRGDSATVEELGAAGGWGLLAHVTRLPRPPRHLSDGHPHLPSHKAAVTGTPTTEEGGGEQPPALNDESRGDSGKNLAKAWVGWVGARRLSLWILREALLTGTGQCRSLGTGAAALTHPARWLVWLVRALLKADPPLKGDHGASPRGQARDQTLMKLAVLNELRLAIGSFAPCEVVMEGCTRVLPLVALRAGRAGSKLPAANEDNAGGSEEETGRRPGVSPNRHPQARMGAANVKVVGRLAGDQRGVVRDALVAEGVMEALLGIVEANASSSTASSSRTAESSLALLCLADLAAGSETAKARLGSTLGYDTLARAAHGAGVAVHAHHFSLWLEASVRRGGGAMARLSPPFVRLVTNPGWAISVAGTVDSSARLGIPTSKAVSLYTGPAGAGREEEGPRDESGERGRGESRGGRRRSWRKRSPQSRTVESVKDGIAWVPRTLPILPRPLGRGVLGSDEEGKNARDGGGVEPGGRADATSAACMFDELWLPLGLLTLAQDVLLINRARGGVVRGEERYFIAQARGVPNSTISGSGYPPWKPVGAKFRGLEAAVFPFLLLPLVPSEYQPQAAGQLSRLLDANPANAAVLCHLRVPLALLKLACLLPEQSEVRDLYFRLAAQLMSHHMSPADALELFHLASLQPSAWARLGRLRVTSGVDLVQNSESYWQRNVRGGGGVVVDQGALDEVRVRTGREDDGVAMPPHSGELQMQLLYVIGTVVDSPSPAWFFHLDGGVGSGLTAGPLNRFPPQRLGYSLSMWLRPAGFAGGSGGENALFSMSGRAEDGTIRTYLRLSLRRCVKPGDSSAPPAAVGIGASEDDDQGTDTDDASALVQVSVSAEERSDQASVSGGGTPVSTAFVSNPEVRCGRWQYLVVTNSRNLDASSPASEWMDGSITVYVDGERRTLATENMGKGRRAETDHGTLAYPPGAGGSSAVSVSVGCWEEGGGREATAIPTKDAGVGGNQAARFSGQIATVALVEGAWTADTAKAAFLRGPGAPPPGKRILFTAPGELSPTPFLDAAGDVEGLGCGGQAGREPGSGTRGGSGDMTEAAAACATSAGNIANPAGPGDGASARRTVVLAGVDQTAEQRTHAGAAPFSAVPTAQSRGVATGQQLPSSETSDPPGVPGPPRQAAAPPRLSVMLAPVRRAIDHKYGVAADGPSERGSVSTPGVAGGTERGPGGGQEASAVGDTPGGDGGTALSESMEAAVNSLAVAAGCGGSKDAVTDSGLSFRPVGRGTWVYASTPLHAAVQAAGGFRLCLPFLRMDHARQVAALRVLAGLLEASAEGMDAFRVRDGFNVLYHALAQGDDALQQLSMDTFDTLFELMTSEALQGAVDVPTSSLSPVTLLDASGRVDDPDEPAAHLARGCTGMKPVRSPEALRLVVDLLGHCEREPELQARVMEALVDALDGSSAGIQVWRRAFNESGAFAPLLYLLSPPTLASMDGAPLRGVGSSNDVLASSGGSGVTRSRSSRRSTPFSMSSAPAGGIGLKRALRGERPAVAAGDAARTQAARMVQVLIVGSAAVAPAVRPQDASAAAATSTSAGCTAEHLATLVGFVLRCHLEAEELTDIARQQMLNTGQDGRFRGDSYRDQSPSASAQSQLSQTRRVGGTVLDLLVQLCGGDGGAVVVGMMSQAFPAGGNFYVALELLSSKHVETRVSAIKLLSLMLVRKGDEGRRSSTSTFFSSDDSPGATRPGLDTRALAAFEKLGGFTAMCRQLELYTTCQAVCDALMGMILGVWGSKHEPIREKDVMAIKGTKESWVRAWWSSYSSPPDEDTANPAPTAQPAAAEGTTSLVNRFRATAAAAVPAATPKPNPKDDAPTTETVIFDLGEGAQDGNNGAEEDESEAPQAQERAGDGAPPAEDQNGDGPGTSTSGGFVKTGRLAALIKAVESSHNSGSSVKVEKETLGQAATPSQGTAGGPDKLGDKEETGFLSGLFRRLSIEHGPAGDAEARALTDTAPLMKIVLSPAEKSGIGGEQAETPALSPFARASPEKLSAREIFDPLPPDPPEPVQADSDKRESVEQKGSDASLDAAAGGGSGGGGAESLNLVLPEAVEVLMHALQRAQSPSVLARPLLQLESAVAWLPAASAHDGHGAGRSGKRDFGGRGPNTEDDGDGGAPRSTGKAVGSGGSGAPAGGTSRGAHKGKDGGDRERNAEALMARPGWLAWCHRLVEALSARNESGDLVPGRPSTGYAYGGNDGDLGGSERWAAGGSEASEAGGYLDDSHSETTDTGSGFSYLESSSVGRSAVPDGASGALEAFTGPVYGLVAALLEQDMASTPRDKKVHRFLDLFSLSNANSFQAAVLEDALDGVQDSPMLSSGTSQEGCEGEAGVDGGGDSSIRRLENLRELLVAALFRRPDLPLGLCVKSVHTINLLGYHSSHEARNRMKSVGLLRVRDDLIRRCLFHPTAASWEKVSALSQVEDALETLVSQPGKSCGEAEATAAGEVAVQLLHLFAEVTAAAIAAQASGLAAHPAGLLSPILRSNTAMSAARATQVAAARALGRVAAASACCRSTLIRVVRDSQLLVQLLPALRCPLTMDELEAIELGNIPEALPSLSTSSRWLLGSLSLPTSSGPTSCMSDDAEDESEALSPQRNKAFFPATPPPSSTGVGSWPPSVPGGNMSSFFAGSSAAGAGGGPSITTPSTVANLPGGSSAQFRLDEVLEEEEEEAGLTADAEVGGGDEAATPATGLASEVELPGGVKSPMARKRTRRRSSSDISSASLGSFAAAGGGSTTNAFSRARTTVAATGGSSWHGPNPGQADGGVAIGGWGVPEHHDLQAFVRWFSGEDKREMRDSLRRRISKALVPLAKARSKTTAKQAPKREKAMRTAQKKEFEFTASREKSATEALERCRAHAEKAADRTSASVDAWLAERRRRWEAGRTRCEELAPPVGGARFGGKPDTAIDTGAAVVSSGSSTISDAAAAGAAAGAGNPGERERDRAEGGRRKAAGGDLRGPVVEDSTRLSSSPWDWGRGAREGARFEDFFDTFAGGEDAPR